MIIKFFRAITRLIANHCIFPKIRIFLFRLSGIEVKNNAYINLDFLVIDDYEGNMVVIEEEVAIAPRVTIITNSYPNNSFIGNQFDISKTGKVTIGRGAWIGAGAIIQPGVFIGKGAIIGSGCVVTHDVSEFSIYAGVPGKKIGDVREKKLL